MVSTRRGKTNALVIGGAGFLGQHLVRALLRKGSYKVSVFDIRPSSEADVETIVGDLRKPDDVLQACKGRDVVFHCATASPSAANASNEELMYAVNVRGTEHVVAACKAGGIPKLVYTSSASVVFEGKDLVGVNEDQPYAARPLDFYTRTKVLGETAVLSANGQGSLATIALRPSGIFGEGDPLFVPVLVDKAAAGKMKYMIGNGRNVMDFTYVGNVAQAHLEAADKLALGSPVAGRPYFITNDDTRPFWEFLGDILQGLGYGRPRIKLPFALIFFIACVFEFVVMPIFKALGRPIAASEFTRNRIKIAASNRQFDISRAKRDLGYLPKVSMEEALQRTVNSFQHLRASENGNSKK
jgi:sterol-4alpha-carboxylate 3-dehydrogenase (decarboxylating)